MSRPVHEDEFEQFGFDRPLPPPSDPGGDAAMDAPHFLDTLTRFAEALAHGAENHGLIAKNAEENRRVLDEIRRRIRESSRR